MTIVWVYLAIGLVVSAVLAGVIASRMLAGTFPASTFDIIASGLFAVGVVLTWPALILFLARDRWRSLSTGDRDSKQALDSEEPDSSPKSKPFRVLEEHLIEELTPPEIEEREWVSDPLGGAPERPFGHLHSVWASFLKNLPPEGRLWKFSARRVEFWGGESLIEGYVIEAGGALGPHILTRMH